MSQLDPNEIFYTQFEPVQKNRFICYIDGFPSYMIKGIGGIGADVGKVKLDHINLSRYVKGKTLWNSVSFTMYQPITPQGSQSIMKWVRLHHESVTGRDGYADFYKKDITFNVLGPNGDIVSEWILKGAQIENYDMGDFNYSDENSAQELSMTVQPDYCILNF